MRPVCPSCSWPTDQEELDAYDGKCGGCWDAGRWTRVDAEVRHLYACPVCPEVAHGPIECRGTLRPHSPERMVEKWYAEVEPASDELWHGVPRRPASCGETRYDAGPYDEMAVPDA